MNAYKIWTTEERELLYDNFDYYIKNKNEAIEAFGRAWSSIHVEANSMGCKKEKRSKRSNEAISIDRKEYNEQWAKQKGFINYADYGQQLLFKKGSGTGLSMSKSINSAPYLGIYIAERLLPNIFQEPKMMPYGNKSYDAICKNGYKVDIKSSILNKHISWDFRINYNKIANAFLCIAFNNRFDLKVQHIWLIPGNDIIRNRKLNEFSSLSIMNIHSSMSCIFKYELTDKLDIANETCFQFNNGILK